MATKGKDLRGSGDKTNVGRKKRPYKVKTVYKEVPEDIHDLCCSLVDAEVLKWRLLNKC